MELKFLERKTFQLLKFPYNISSQIVFKTLENSIEFLFLWNVPKKPAKRICERPGGKAYGILSVLCQIFYNTEYLFSVAPLVFSPPKSRFWVIALTKKRIYPTISMKRLLFRVVKLSFQQKNPKKQS